MKSNKYIEFIINRNGLSRNERSIAALNPSFFMPDERKQEDFIEFVSRFSQFVNYYNDQNLPEGDWNRFYKNNITLLLLFLSKYETEFLEKQFERLYAKLKDEFSPFEHIEVIKETNRLFSKLFENIDKWYQISAEINSFQLEIEGLIKNKLSPPLLEWKSIQSKLQQIGIFDKLMYSLDLGAPWKTNSEEKKTSSSKEHFLKISKRQIRNIFIELINSINFIKESAETYFNKHIHDNNNLEPHIGMLLTFLELYKHPQEEINLFTKKHLDYYYQEILKERYSEAKPNFINLTFELAKKVDEVMLPKETILQAGIDENGDDIIYETTRELIINKASLGKKLALVNEEKPFIDFVPPSEDSGLKTFIIERSQQYKTNTITKRVKEYNEQNSFNFGMAICSPVLILEEGYRRIRLTFDVQKESLWDFIERIDKHFPEKKLNIPSDINPLIKHLFNIEFSIMDGWFKPAKEKIECKLIEDKKETIISVIQITVLLEPNDPALVPPTDKMFDSAIKKAFPAVKILLNEEISYLYHDAKNIEINALEIDVEGLNIRNLILQNDYGLLDINAPVFPFGPIPKLASSFYIGHKTIFNHYITDLAIVMEWLDVPNEDNGFEEYYDGYSYIDSNDVFKAKISILHNKRWQPEEDQQALNLFEDVDIESEETPANNHRRIDNIDMHKLTIKENVPVNLDKSFTVNSSHGFIKMELCYPPNAFGHKEYPEILKASINKNLKKKHPEELPKEPYTPTLKNISVDYYASQFINLRKKQQDAIVYTLHPYGIEQNKYPFNHILPVYENELELYIEIENLETPGTLNMLFQINELKIKDTSFNSKNEGWYYLESNKWIPINENEILYDSTSNLIKSGIISFDFHNKIKNKNNTILSNKGLWLKYESSRGQNLLNSIIDIHLHAVESKWVPQNDNIYSIQAETITQLNKPNKKISSVLQPYSSYGGREAETEEAFNMRVSENLRHKNRCSSIWDIEHTVLQEFPEIYKVKCHNCYNKKNKFSPGQFLVVVIPEILSNSLQNTSEPQISYYKLKEIEQLILKRISPFIKLEVCNPSYEKIQVKLDVKFKEGKDEGYYKKMLNHDLRRLLSPWLMDNKKKPDFGSVVHGSSILNYIQNLDYIYYIENFSLFHIVNDIIINKGQALNNDVIIKPFTPLSILSSADEHYIRLVDKLTPDGEGVNDMIIETDFMVQKMFSKKYFSEQGVENTSIGFNFEVDEDKDVDENTEGFIIDFK